MSIIKGNHAGLGGAGAPGGALGSFYSHTINQSLRIDGAGYLSKTWGAGADSNQIFTFSAWIKKVTEGDGSSSTDFSIISSVNAGSGTGQGYTLLGFERGDALLYYTQNGGNNGKTYRKFRDYSSWYHFVWQYDTTQSTENDRIKIYVNGEHIVTNTTNYDASVGFGLFPALNSVMTSMNQNGRLNEIGDDASGTMPSSSFYIAEVIMLDGVTQTADAFGETKDSVWVPKAYSGSFGTNGYHLDFADSSAIGNDVSGNNNDWTANNLAATDVVLDSPTNVFATFNPLLYNANVYSEGNLKNASAGNDYEIQVATMFPAGISGKWYAEFYVHTCNASGTRVGVGVTDTDVDPEEYLGNESPDVAYYDINDIYTGGSKTADTDATFAAGDIISVALNLDDGEVTFRKNNSTMSNGTQNLIASTLYTFATTNYGSGAGVVANFGQDDTFAGNKTSGSAASADGNGIGDFYYAPPSGFVALCTSNLQDITIGPGQDTQADDHFNTVLYTGNSSTQSITGVGFQSDWTWIKNRATTDAHALTDSVRGVTKELTFNTNSAESTNADGLTAFGDDGFSLGDDDIYNTNAEGYVSWNWKGGGSASTNTDGSGIDSSVSANADAGFSVLTYTGTGNTSHTIGHGLGKTPAFVMSKSRDTGSGGGSYWFIKWEGLTSNNNLVYFTDAQANIATNYAGGGWSDFDSSNTTTLVPRIGYTGSSVDSVNKSGEDYVAWVFAEIEGFSSIGSFTGNGADDGPFVYTGFRPTFVMSKRVDAAADWHIMDDKRNPFNLMDGLLFPSGTYAESSDAAYGRDFLSNGFKIRGSEAYVNASGGTFVYMAFAHSPYKFANAF